MDSEPRLLAGAMSGTSADGVDVAIVEIRGHGLDMSVNLLGQRHIPYDPNLRQQIFAIRADARAALADLARLGHEISLVYAVAVNQALEQLRIDRRDLSGMAAHGQTLFHNPPDTLQWLDPALLAAATNCPVISDFRRADCAAGGQGAPLVPFADYVLFHSKQTDRALVNIGGIANITCLFKSGGLERVLAWDTGPGNCISDHLTRKYNVGQFDEDGALAMKGNVSRELVDAVCSDKYFKKRGSKSTDGPMMIGIFEDAIAKLGSNLSLEDQLATACAICASEIARALNCFGTPRNVEIIVSGGGTKNHMILQQLGSRGIVTRTTDDLGVPSQAKEAIAFALLGAATLDGFPSNVPSATGAKRSVILGSITPRP